MIVVSDKLFHWRILEVNHTHHKFYLIQYIWYYCISKKIFLAWICLKHIGNNKVGNDTHLKSGEELKYMRRTNFPFFSGSSVVGNMTYLPLFRVTRSKIALANPNTDVWTVSILSCILYSLLMSVYIKYKSRFTYYTCKSILQIQISNCFSTILLTTLHLKFSFNQ